MADWQLTETAPFETDSFGDKWLPWCLLFSPDEHGGVVVVGGMDAGIWLNRDDVRKCAEFEKPPTHWMPLPKPPQPLRGKLHG